MFDDLHWWRRGQLHHLPPARQMDPAQVALARWAMLQPMRDDLGRTLQAAGVVLLWSTLLSRLLGLLGHIRFHEGRWRRFLRFQLRNPLLGSGQRRSQLDILRLHTVQVGAYLGQFFFQTHVTSLPALVNSEHLLCKASLRKCFQVCYSIVWCSVLFV
jgi:hypothetical protein